MGTSAGKDKARGPSEDAPVPRELPATAAEEPTGVSATISSADAGPKGAQAESAAAEGATPAEVAGDVMSEPEPKSHPVAEAVQPAVEEPAPEEPEPEDADQAAAEEAAAPEVPPAEVEETAAEPAEAPPAAEDPAPAQEPDAEPEQAASDPPVSPDASGGLAKRTDPVSGQEMTFAQFLSYHGNSKGRQQWRLADKSESPKSAGSGRRRGKGSPRGKR
eukprot:TRINITY_DN15669_c3_g1_i1.p1 TRINITY_DN15669_c3_g1~~TRINITY_DN15669_c3_g1_i1.p1  ORF type:complete len:219 (+),score=64.49 TRINITY_DN15669_c3_g1_i1:51-707(+)